jgi:FMN phosphatase YigB (HAD superfamily)
VKTLLFDLDGTLLPVRLEELVRPYMGALTRHWGPLLAASTPPEKIPEHVMASMEMMVRSANPARTNGEVYWEALQARIGAPIDALGGQSFVDFYRDVFPKLRGLYADRLPGTGRALVQAALDAGFEIVLATNAIWPGVAIEERMRWADVHDFPWKLVTHFDNMHFCKPHPGYYLEILERIGREPGQCFMVGNDVDEDGVAAKRAGLRVVLLTDWIENRRDTPLDGLPTTTAEALIERLRSGADPV